MGGKLEALPGARGESGFLKTARVVFQVGASPAENDQLAGLIWFKCAPPSAPFAEKSLRSNKVHKQRRESAQGGEAEV